MAFFDSFTDAIKQKWLHFFEVNREWIVVQMAAQSMSTPDGGKRPSTYLILGVVNALEPKLAQLMFPFAKLNPDPDILVEVLGLNFDPDLALAGQAGNPDDGKVYSDAPSVVGENPSLVNRSLGLNLPDDDEFNDFNQSHETGMGELVSDVWGGDSSGNGEELPPRVFDGSEMARLFPEN